MYSHRIIQRAQDRLEYELEINLKRYDVPEVLTRRKDLDKIYDHDRKGPKRPLKKEEIEYVRNERLLCSIDFLYWAERYMYIIADGVFGGGLQLFSPMESQRIILALIAKLEDMQTEAWDRGDPVDGILIALHKARQLGATMFKRGLDMHRLITSEHVLAIAASVDDDKVELIQDRDRRIIDNLPWWMKPETGYDVKGGHITFPRLDNKLLYQTLVQKAGLGQGEQWTLGHITEAASDPWGGGEIQHNYTPAIPQGPKSLHMLETTAQGRNNWWRFFVDDIRRNVARWKFCFIPWYAEERKYRRVPPVGWEPNEASMQHAKKIYETSAEFIGKSLYISKEQLYWWETTRDEYARKKELHIFLSNYCATPEESFQHTTHSIFNPELLDKLRNVSYIPEHAYEMRSC